MSKVRELALGVKFTLRMDGWVDFSMLESYSKMEMNLLHLHHGHHHHHAESVLAGVSGVAK
jgi:hypothetical protein